MSDLRMTRRRLLRAGLGTVTASALGGCKIFDGLSAPDHRLRQFMERANDLTMAMQRGMLDRDALAQEFTPADIRQPQRPNGVTDPQDDIYVALRDGGFADYRLEVSGLVARPLSLSLDDLRQMPTRTQITRHDCVEGWSCIAQWSGVPLAQVLDRAGVIVAEDRVLRRLRVKPREVQPTLQRLDHFLASDEFIQDVAVGTARGGHVGDAPEKFDR